MGIAKELYKAAESGDICFIAEALNKEKESSSYEYFLGQAYPKKENFLHIAIQNNPFKFIAEIVTLLPTDITDKLISQEDKDGNTPLHVAAKVDDCGTFLLFLNYADKGWHEASQPRRETLEKALQKRNTDDNMPIHVAVINGKTLYDAMVIAQWLDKFINVVACQKGNNKQTIWHLLLKQPVNFLSKIVETAKKKSEMINLMKEKDADGKTPLHLALKDGRFSHTYCFLYELLPSDDRHKWLEYLRELLEIKDEYGTTPGDLIASISELPLYLEKIFVDNPTLAGYRSVYGISTKETKDYVNTMGVIAALLTTITFTVAFTVPGGLIQEKGTPILINTAAFQAFMFFDITAMCQSIMVLFCLLWILAAGNNRNSLMLMDYSIFLLLTSFYTTLLTFMTGVYATTIHVKPWIAIYTLVICSLLMLLMHKYFVVKFLAPFGHISFRLVKKYLYTSFTEPVDAHPLEQIQCDN